MAKDKETIRKRPSSIVRLNVGGKKFCTTLSTLRCEQMDEETTGTTPFGLSGPHGAGNALVRMVELDLEGRLESLHDEEGYFFIDRSGRVFEWVLEYLRTGEITPIPSRGVSKARLIRELLYFQIFQHQVIAPVSNPPPTAGGLTSPNGATRPSSTFQQPADQHRDHRRSLSPQSLGHQPLSPQMSAVALATLARTGTTTQQPNIPSSSSAVPIPTPSSSNSRFHSGSFSLAPSGSLPSASLSVLTTNTAAAQSSSTPSLAPSQAPPLTSSASANPVVPSSSTVSSSSSSSSTTAAVSPTKGCHSPPMRPPPPLHSPPSRTVSVSSPPPARTFSLSLPPSCQDPNSILSTRRRVENQLREYRRLAEMFWNDVAEITWNAIEAFVTNSNSPSRCPYHRLAYEDNRVNLPSKMGPLQQQAIIEVIERETQMKVLRWGFRTDYHTLSRSFCVELEVSITAYDVDRLPPVEAIYDLLEKTSRANDWTSMTSLGAPRRMLATYKPNFQ